ncbi:Polyketide synthase-nonribosomal peptide synthetase [Colletotrichum orbiculare MAFF 240422]|uniref:Polyketide synthase-nonribosomal peptide synthetase n=1 Tax=Colletotrichum orbiculare (strain 104-T / ATCC 96160 / CBS 514.97 / LARS 414 / MAFF 240422) TaxID=1213857 RepID=N4VHJ7_COLOR|nr:Polyketide synthase-nonribosomal peptide synthetase [Colletotrichum orbiculare MAFF 240422]
MKTQNEPIAVIGTGCRFPGTCDSPSKLWELLRQPRDLLKEIPDDRFSADGFYHPKGSHHGTSNVRHSYLLDEDLRAFDAQFFGIKATEASSIDPQQRLLMETVYEALEAAGLSVRRLQGSDTAVYVGVMSADFTDMLARDIEKFPTYFATGTARSILSNRLSYFFDWHGPSMTIDTACSSSLIALHQAVQVLRSGQSTVAVAAGSNLILGPEQYIAESKLQMLSPGGRSRMWDAEADGYARGEGVAAVVLKTLSQALADGDDIECVIRETGINQDGKTPGITMPSSTAQAALIRATYARAGLDLSKASDRPQFFEAHGTGTPAGDPIEAAAISDAFFGNDVKAKAADALDTLYVGSIKTVIGHTEGTAGLAAIIKASQALQSGTMPPNRLFNRLNPKIEPFYANLRILTAAQPWPRIPDGGIRRVSVNSFGFGGANAHAIVESADAYVARKPAAPSPRSFAPCLLSAASDTVLAAMVDRLKSFLKSSQTAGGGGSSNRLNMRDLAWTLCNRRSTLGCRTVVPAARDAQDLLEKLDATTAQAPVANPAGKASSDAGLRVFGVFTGQGAQWPRMAAELIEDSPAVAAIVQRLDQSLQSLPAKDRPEWTLREQLLAPKETSMVGIASLSQPLCTAVQVILVDLLKVAGVRFSAVVGHSSGEIGAAYAAGYLSASDAIRVAYYRGLHLKLVTTRGAMLAAGTTFEDARELCSLPAFEGRACVAASNSPSSVTLSGDADAIEEIQVILDEEKKFNRMLKVDRAYHSHHMRVLAEPYRRSLEECGIEVAPRPAGAGGCRWVSSVFTCDISEIPSRVSLGSSYWVANLVEPVRFAEALEVLYLGNTMDGMFDLGIEVGPHPALQGPVKQTVQEYTADSPLAYTGLLERGKNSTETLSKSLGYVWQTFGEGNVDFDAYEAFCAGDEADKQPFTVTKGLPTYPWDHSRTLWQESRLSKAFRTNKNRPHELLGRQILDGVPGRLRWRNVIKRSEIDWLEGHQVQGQVVFPAAAYVSACVEACMRSFSGDGSSVQCIELRDFDIGHAMVFEDDDSTGVDATIELGEIVKSNSTVSARFGFHSTSSNDSLAMNTHASCSVVVVLGESDAHLLPPKPAVDEDDFLLLDVEEDRFYNNLDGLGFGYSGPFRALQGLKRRLGYAEGFIQNPSSTVDINVQPPLLVHPATLDAGIQSIMMAYSYPGDTMLRSVYVPTRFERILVNPAHCADFAGQPVTVPFDSVAFTGAAKSVTGDINIYSPRGTAFKALQLEGLQTRPLSDPTQSDGINIFTEMSWGVAKPDAETVIETTSVPALDGEFFFSLERVAYYYHRLLGSAFPPHEREDLEWNFKRLLEYNDYVLTSVRRGTNPFAREEWKHDTKETITAILDSYPDSADLRLMRAVGDNIVAVARKETSMLEHMIQDNKLNNFYEFGEGFPRYTSYLASFAGQVAHRHPHMKVLEIGAGTGGATKAVLREVGDQFASYAFTDISGGFFEKAAHVFAPHKAKMSFRVLDIEKDPLAQGFEEGGYDLIVASLVLHATRNLAETMVNVRKLLKPGGYLLLLEITENEQMRFGLLFGGLPGWWLGAEDGRVLSPCIGLEGWDAVFKQTGFSGVETVVPHHDTLPVPLSVIVAQAVDGKVEFLKQPLADASSDVVIPRLTIIGGGPESSALASEVTTLLGPHYGAISFVESLESLRDGDLGVGGSVLCLADIDGPVLRSIDATRLRGFQDVFKQSKHVLWVTRGVRDGDPYARMVVGFGRTIVLEMLHLRLQFLDLDTRARPSPSAIAEAMLRFDVAGTWDENGDLASSLLHSHEPELFLAANGKLFVPRFKLSPDMNNRYKSGRGTVRELVDTETSTVELHHQSDEKVWELREVDDALAARPSWYERERVVDVDVTYAVNRAVAATRDCFLFPLLGRDVRTGESVLALAPTLASKVSIPRSFVLYGVRVPDDKAVDVVEMFYSELVARAALGSDSLSGTRVILIEPRHHLAEAITDLAADQGASVLCLTSKTDTTSKWTHVGPRTPRLAIQHLIKPYTAPDVSYCVLDMAEDGNVTAAISDFLPQAQCRVVHKSDLTGSAGHLPTRDCSRDVRSLLADASGHVLDDRRMGKDVRGTGAALPVLPPTEAAAQSNPAELIVSWGSMDRTVAVSVGPIDTKVRFQSDKTYWLVGLTGNLGLSLCAWMVRQGARHIAISSRNPKVDAGFLSKMRAKGVAIHLLAVDVCDRSSVQVAHATIAATMPEVAGVAQGAMVLHDTMFSELDVERVEKVTRPKIEGSLHLEELFQSAALDFFVFFSSMACVVGNPGQSAYAAANMFMSGLATRRRNRGLNASAVHIGAIFGNGYVTRELTLAQQEYLKRVGNQWLSEQDFHTLFAEAVYAGQASRGRNPELATGLMIIDDGDDFGKNVTWFTNPMFQHCVRTAQNQSQGVDSGKKGRRVQAKVQLQEAVSSDDVREIIYDAFAAKLQDALQVEEGRAVGNLTADNLGIDSLVAVDIRSWFIKEFQVEIPVLKILSGATVDDIIAQAQKLLPKELVPRFDANATGLSQPREKATVQKAEPVKPKPKDAGPSSAAKQDVKPVTSLSVPKEDVKPVVAKPVVPKTETMKMDTKKMEPPRPEMAKPETPKMESLKPAVPKMEPPRPETKMEVSDDAFVRQSPSMLADSLTSPTEASRRGSVFDSSVVSGPDSPASSLSTPLSDIDEKPEIQCEQLYQNAVSTLAEPDVCKYLAQNNAVAGAGTHVVKSVPVSFAQSQFWFLQHFLEKPATALNIAMAIDLRGPLNIQKLERAVAAVGKRHEALRTRFTTATSSEGGGVVQEVLAGSCLGLETYEINDVTHAEQFYEALVNHKYRLDEGENMRVILLRMTPVSFRLLTGYHHINMDGVSLEVVLRELQLGYDGHALAPVRDLLQYPDFAKQQRLDYEAGRWADDLDFWRTEFRGQAPPVLPILPLAKTQSRVPLTSYATTTSEFHLDGSVSAAIQSVCGLLKVTPFHFHLAVFYTLLARLVDADELCIGVSSANRQTPETMQSVGMYLNLLPLLFKVDRSYTFANALKLVRSKSLTAFSHAAVPFDVIVKELGVAGATSHSPVFQAMVNYRPGVSEARSFCDCESEILTFKQGEVAYDLTLDIIENPGGACRVMLSGQSVFYGDAEMDHLKRMYAELVTAFSRNPATRLSAAPIYGSEDVKTAIELGRGPFRKPQWPATLVHRIDDMVERYPDRTAVKNGQGASVTYQEMAQRVGAISGALSKHSSRPVGVGSKVGVLLDPGVDWVCSILAVLRLGATYVPLDMTTGWERLSSVVKDCGPDVVLVNSRTQPEAKHLQPAGAPEQLQPQLQLVNVETIATAMNQHAGGPIAARSDLVAALMYTSGSTGVPKGIVMKHESFRNTVEVLTRMVSYREGRETSLHQSSYSFDMSLSQIFLALSNGGTVHVVPRELRGDPVAIADIIASEGVTFTTATPSEAISWIEYGNAAALRTSSWTKLLSGGEPVRESLTNSLRKVDNPSLELVDCYGPTEITFCCGTRTVDYRRETAPAETSGFETWPNYSVYILDANRKPVPAGVLGEIAVGGGGVVSGYSHRELNAGGFAHDPWASREFAESGWTRVHLTGDTGKLNPADGTLVLGGRIAGDTQIKLRGMRIDVREIETAISQAAAGAISDVVVAARESKATGASSLIAFVVTTGSKTSQNLSPILARLPLPQYMRPAAIIPLDGFPKNPSGKVDRIALKTMPLPQAQELEIQSAGRDGDDKLNDVEARLLQLWQQLVSPEVLSQYQITRDSNFFHVGGSSVLLVQLRAQVEAVFGTNVTLYQLFESSTLAGMAAVVSSLSSPSSGGGTQAAPAADIDWEEETSVPPDLLRIRGQRFHFGNPSVVVLTGSTGFLGRAILSRLLEDSIVEKIHCLAVRRDPRDGDNDDDDLFRSPKVVVHRGDLAAPHFGLSETALAGIFSQAHAVIHNAADVSFMKSYATLKPVNFDTAKALVRLSLPRRASFHYISSASIVQLTGRETWGPESVKQFPPTADRNASGYIAAKWASERFLEKVSDQCDLPIWIHRPSSIKGAGAPAGDLVSNLLHYSRATRSMPDVGAWSGWLDLVSVESAATQVADEVYKDFSWPGKVAYLYESGGEIVPLTDLRATLEREAGCEYEVLAMDEWTARAEGQGMSVLLGDYLRGAANAPVTLTMLQKEEAWL